MPAYTSPLALCRDLYFIFFWPYHVAHGILVPWPGIQPTPPALRAQNLNHWTSREVPPLLPVLHLAFPYPLPVDSQSVQIPPVSPHSLCCLPLLGAALLSCTRAGASPGYFCHRQVLWSALHEWRSDTWYWCPPERVWFLKPTRADNYRYCSLVSQW